MASGTILGEYSSSAVQADRLWKAAFFDGHNLLPKILTGIITSIDILKGDGAAVHSVRMTNFTDGSFDLTIHLSWILIYVHAGVARSILLLTIIKIQLCAANKDCKCVKDRVEVMDRENLSVKYCILDGGVLGVKVKSYSVGFCVTSTDEGGCLVKMEIVYESIGESLLPKKDANDLQQGILSMVKAVDDYLVANPDAYA